MSKSPTPAPVQSSVHRVWVAGQRWGLALVQVYFTLLFGGLLAQFVLGEAHWSLFALNALKLYLFIPLPLVLGLACLVRRRWIWAGVALGTLGWAGLYGELFLPKFPPAVNGPTLTFMTYNALGSSNNSPAVVEALRASGVDVAAVQELNPQNAAAIAAQLSAEFPYQWLDPRPDVTGSGILSRYPLTPTGVSLAGGWIGTPQIATLDFNGQPVTLVLFHAYAGINNFREREAEARLLADFTHTQTGPLVILGDLNATDMNRAYALLTGAGLRDAWREAGWGFGHTFPGGDTPGNNRPRLGNLPVPAWLVRIDFIFHSAHWRAVNAAIGPWDNTSDHRPVLAELFLVHP